MIAADLSLWHQRMAHVNAGGIRDMVKNGVVEGVNLDLKSDASECTACVYGKSTRAPVPRQGGSRSSKILDLVHTDVCGPFPVESLGGSRYFLSFVDDYSRYAWIYPIKAKSEVFGRLKQWLSMVERMHETKVQTLQAGESLRNMIAPDSNDKVVKVLQSDNGGEYLSTQMIQFLQERGITHRLTTPRNPHQNGVAERMNRTLVELTRSMLHAKQVPKSFWAEALNVAVHIRNRVTSHSLPSRTTPYEILFGRKPNLSYLRVFGSRCWYTQDKAAIDKLDKRAREAIMIGYARGSRGYKLWDIEKKKPVVSRDVRFDETGQCSPSESSPTSFTDSVEPTSFNPSNETTESSGENTMQSGDSNTDEAGNGEDSNDESSTGSSEAASTTVPEDTTPAPRYPQRERNPPGEWFKAAAALIASSGDEDPRTFSEAVNSDKGAEWMKSMKSEHESLLKNKCWELVPRPPAGTNVIRSKWVYKTKEEQTTLGTLGSRLRARMVALGCNQIEGIDYTETYAPVVKLTSLRIILAMVTMMTLFLHQMDFKTAFLNGDLNETIYMEQPKGFEVGNPAHVVCRLLKSLYGLKQAPRQWYAKIDDFFVRVMGMKRNPADDCVYIRRQGGQLLIIALYVDDLLIACSHESVLMDLKQKLRQQFEMKDLGESKILLGMDISRDLEAGTLSISQSRYAQKIIERFGMGSARGQATPMDPSIDLTAPSPPCYEPYRAAIGSLMYLMVGTRPDLAFCVGRLAKYVQNPTMLQWEAVKRVIRYVIHTKDLGLVYGGTNASDSPSVYTHADWAGNYENPSVFVDADWAGDPETRKSVSGFVAMMGGAAVSWCAKQQEVVALSSAESEYISMASGAKETVWLRRFWSGLEVVPRMNEPTTVFVDNQAAMSFARNAAVNRRNKHIDVRYHFTRDQVSNGTLDLSYCPTEEMIADIMTKALGRIKLNKFVQAMGLRMAKSADHQ